MADQSNPSARGDHQITFPCLQYLAEFTCFAPEFDYVRAYEIPPQITSIEWLNRDRNSTSNSFVVANDKKIRLIKLRKQFMDEVRRNDEENHQDAFDQIDRESTFVDRFLKSNGQIVFPKTNLYN